MYQNVLDTLGECAKVGESAEFQFRKILISQARVFRAATLDEQFEHIDFIVDNADGSKAKYEVKAQKKINRSDANFSNNTVWVEFKNVAGKLGWLYGQADFIVFERENDFMLVYRKTLAAFCEKHCDINNLVSTPSEALYKAYQRAGRKDLISIIPAKEVENISLAYFKKI